jgi:hypothetical protein
MEGFAYPGRKKSSLFKEARSRKDELEVSGLVLISLESIF